MTWNEIQIEALKKMFLNKENLETSKIDEYKQDKKYKTYLFGMKQACNEALLQIYAVIESNVLVYKLENEKKRIYDLKELIEDYEKVFDIEAPLNVTWKMISKNLIQIDNWTTGDINIYYEKKHEYITDDTPGDKVIEIDKEWLQLLPLYIAGELYKDDDLTLSTIYLNEFNNILGILSSKNNSNQTTPLYRMD